MVEPQTLIQAVRYFSDPAVCRDILAARRWPDGVTCHRCGGENPWFKRAKGIWRCRACKRDFSVKVGTIFEDSPISLTRWFPAIWLVSSSKKSVSSPQLAKAIGVTQKTAWFMLHRIRLLMRDESRGKFSGQIEADETFVGGRSRNMHRGRRARLLEGQARGTTGKAVVMGVLERTSTERPSRVHAKVIRTNNRHTVLTEIRRNVEMDGRSTVYTDALRSYERPSRWTPRDGYTHEAIDHAIAYVNGLIHTNGLENFWSLFKRTVVGTHHSVSPVHLDRYLDDATYRFNTRKLNDADRFEATISVAAGRRLTYRELTGKTTEAV